MKPIAAVCLLVGSAAWPCSPPVFNYEVVSTFPSAGAIVGPKLLPRLVYRDERFPRWPDAGTVTFAGLGIAFGARVSLFGPDGGSVFFKQETEGQVLFAGDGGSGVAGYVLTGFPDAPLAPGPYSIQWRARDNTPLGSAEITVVEDGGIGGPALPADPLSLSVRRLQAMFVEKSGLLPSCGCKTLRTIEQTRSVLELGIPADTSDAGTWFDLQVRIFGTGTAEYAFKVEVVPQSRPTQLSYDLGQRLRDRPLPADAQVCVRIHALDPYRNATIDPREVCAPIQPDVAILGPESSCEGSDTEPKSDAGAAAAGDAGENDGGIAPVPTAPGCGCSTGSGAPTALFVLLLALGRLAAGRYRRTRPVVCHRCTSA